jgi:HSP20 family protein
MNDLIVRRTPSTELPGLSALHPLRSLRELLAWDPFQEMAPMLPVEFQRVIPPFEVRETKDRFVFQADLPGIEAKDIEILLTGNRITITGTRIDKVEKGEEGEYYARERTYGRFTRSFTLPEGADLNAVQAHLASGVLTIVFPKVPAVQPKKIPVTVEKVAKV